MTSLATVAIDRTSLGISALTIVSDGFSTYYLDVGGLGRAGKTPRETFATAPPWLHGQLRTAVALEEATLPLVVRVQASTSSGLDTAVEALEAAVGQFVYTVTKTVDGIVKVYEAYPATIQATDALTAVERVRNYYEDLSISIPVYPIAS